jgi:putative oxidoreductase
MTDMTNGTAGRNGWTIGLWAAQVLLALFYLYAGYNKLTQPIDALATMGMGFVLVVPELLTRFIGVAEVLGAAGLILPAATRILPRLTPLAALGLSTIQVLAILLHASRGEFMVLPMNLVLLALSLFVLWGRERKAPISAR